MRKTKTSEVYASDRMLTDSKGRLIYEISTKLSNVIAELILSCNINFNVHKIFAVK